jgi:phosphoglycolate phosphatase-like HAD superfamily hydrolase
MRIGLDFDNTIVCYDQAVKRAADQVVNLPAELERTKKKVRDYLRLNSREPEWTAFQGELYGPGMQYARPYEGAIETMHQLIADGHELVIISHRSRHPYAGPRHDLHAAARTWVADWLQSVGLFDERGNQTCVYSGNTRSETGNDQQVGM